MAYEKLLTAAQNYEASMEAAGYGDINTFQSIPSSSGINDFHDAGNAAIMQNNQGFVSTGEPTTDTGQEDSEGRKYPSPPTHLNGIMGLPSVFMPSDNYGPDMQTIFVNSFPILTVTPFSMNASDKNYTQNTSAIEKGPTYKFALQNDGGVSVTANNDYGPTMIEDMFKDVAENSFGVLRDMNQMVQNNGQFGSAIGSTVKNVRNSGLEAWTKIYENFMKAMQINPGDSKAAGFGKSAGGAAGNILNMFGNALIFGNRIDIPNVWKGSTGGSTASVKIDLRAVGVGGFDGGSGEAAYQNLIVKPITILLALALPLRMTEGDTNGSGVTYENPPYLQAHIDKIFESKCCAIKNLTIQFDYRETSYYMKRPMHAVATFDLIDMYEVMVWDNKATSKEKPPESDFIPSSARFISRMVDPEQGTPLPQMQTSLLQYAKAGSSGLGLGGIASSFSESLGSSLSGVLSSVGQDILPLGDDDLTSQWFYSKYSGSSDQLGKILESTTMANDYFNDSVFNINTGGGFDISSVASLKVNTVGDSIQNQMFGNFNISTITTTIDEITEIPNAIQSVFNGVRDEIKNVVPKVVVNNFGGEISKYTDPVSLLKNTEGYQKYENSIQQLDSILNMKYTVIHDI